MKLPTTVGERIRAAREARGLTQQQAAEAIGVSSGTISRYERDEFTPRGERLTSLARLVRRSPEWIISGEAAARNDPSGVREAPAVYGRELTFQAVQALCDELEASDTERGELTAHLMSAEWKDRGFRPDESYVRGWLARARAAEG